MTARSPQQPTCSRTRQHPCVGSTQASLHLVTMLFALGVLAWTPGHALAGTTGAEFQPMFQLLTDWIGGYLGRSIAIGAFIIGVGYGAFAQRYLVALGGIFVALLVLIVPQVLNGMLTATI